MPLEIDQVTVSLEVNFPTEVIFSFMDIPLDKSPDCPESPVISGAISSTSKIFTETDCEDVLFDSSNASISTK